MRLHTPRSYVVSITPFLDDGTIDEVAFRRHLLRMGDGGQSVYVASTNVGEGFALSDREQERLLAISVETLRGVTTVRHGGREARSIEEALQTIRHATRAGLDAVHIFQLDLGHASARPSIEELDAYYTAVVQECSIPVVISNYPALGYSLPLELIASLVDRFPQITAFRDAGGDIAYLQQLRSRFSTRLEIYLAGARNLANAALFSLGAMTIEANIAPRLARNLQLSTQSTDLNKLREVYNEFIDLHVSLSKCNAAPAAAIKAILSQHGYCRPNQKLPRKIPENLAERLHAQLPAGILSELRAA